jgi:mycofactocin biosynthetic radical S-adenosylmethionine protein MftC
VSTEPDGQGSGPASGRPVGTGETDGILAGRWRKARGISIRPEPFGAMANDFETRRLFFLKSRALAEVVDALDGSGTALEACRKAGVSERELPGVARALQTLADKHVLVPEGRPAPALAVGAATRAGGDGRAGGRLADRLAEGLAAPICITWELTYACNLACVHCLSSSGRRDPAELTTRECERVIDDLERMHVFYANVGGGEPTIRRDFWHLLEYAADHHVGVKFSTNGTRIDRAVADLLSRSPSVDVQISLDGATAEVNDAVRGSGSFTAAVEAMEHLAGAGCTGFKVSVVATRRNIDEMDALAALADRYGAQLRVTRLRPSGRAAEVWDDLHPTSAQQRRLYDWLQARSDRVLTGDSFFHLGALGDPLPGLNLCGAGRIVCLIDPVGDVYACPFTIHEEFRAGNVRAGGGFAQIWRGSEHFAALRRSHLGATCTACHAAGTCRGGCMAAKFFTGRQLDDPDPECVMGHAAPAVLGPTRRPRPPVDHSRRSSGTPVALLDRPAGDRAGDRSPIGLSRG